MEAQMDLTKEADNLEEFAKNFAKETNVRFPSVDKRFRHHQVLVESYEEGKPISEFLSTKYSPGFKAALAGVGMHALLKMILLDNFIHADLHPGNILVSMPRPRPHNTIPATVNTSPSSYTATAGLVVSSTDLSTSTDGDGSVSPVPQIILVDAGLVTKLAERDHINLLELLYAVARGDGERAANLIVERAPNNAQLSKETIDRFTREMQGVIQLVAEKPLSEVEVGKVLSSVLTIARKHKVSIESNYTTLVVGILILEGIGRQLNPDFNFIKELTPVLTKRMVSLGLTGVKNIVSLI